ncbi:hypothetical protein PUNSTDRAFT_130510 [Punctularia strigosozonata HHB-11173 SS5]|uniref:uncharacterized protein n=1 Tax=Punctularia strigosozonata (strain HHB-11173) TaxID=741275 RepID=UPI0004416CE8|nr:uncharacterized protein PUNSTDRAFT_130510 [Punctularia strigosozonata HHB-11173 SS5]EIN12244.1 hypothetical protein PUNSTDRAFT_130510 [Punctularia strigosozonata HHB-11173 SS5]
MSPSSPRARTDYLFSSPRVLGRLPSMGFSELQLKTMILPAASKQFGTGEHVRDTQDVEAGAMATGNAAEDVFDHRRFALVFPNSRIYLPQIGEDLDGLDVPPPAPIPGLRTSYKNPGLNRSPFGLS